MKITVIDNKIVCTQDDFNNEFWNKVGLNFFRYSPFKKPKLMYEACVEPIDYDYKTDLVGMEYNYRILCCILSYAKDYGIEVADEVIIRRNQLMEMIKALKEEISKQEENERKRLHWKYLKAKGCGTCKNLQYKIDVPLCGATNEELIEKETPQYVLDKNNEFTYCPYVYTPFPSDNCPYKV